MEFELKVKQVFYNNLVNAVLAFSKDERNLPVGRMTVVVTLTRTDAAP